MPQAPPNHGQFKRQIVFRICPDDWPLLEHATAEHGSIQAAVLAGLRALAQTRQPQAENTGSDPPEEGASLAAYDQTAESDEIRARDAARILGIKTSTVSRYIRTGRLPGRYDGSRWLTTRSAVAAYRKRTRVRH